MATEQSIPIGVPVVGQGPTRAEVQTMLNRLQRMCPTNVVPLGPGSFWPGLSMHDFFAGQIINGLMQGKNVLGYGPSDMERISKKAYDMASTMMAVREAYFELLKTAWDQQDKVAVEKAQAAAEAARGAASSAPEEDPEERSPRSKTVFK